MRIDVKTLLILASLPLLLIAIALVQWGSMGLPALPSATSMAAIMQPQGFPSWLRIGHFINALFFILLVRSGLQILMDHPRLYWNVHCTPGTEWLRLTPVAMPKDRMWTAKEDARHLSPWIGLPGYRHTVGMARHWHFLSVLFWIGNGFVYVALLFATDAWHRLVPTSWHVVPDAWAVFVHYATLHLPQEPNGFFHYNALQQLSYFSVVFILAPLALITGPSMSPAFTARFPWYPRLPGNRQIGRSLHFLVMCAFIAFTGMHIAMVAITGLTQNMNHIVVGTDAANTTGLWIGAIGITLIIGLNAGANLLAWRQPRLVQHTAKLIITPIMRLLFGRAVPTAQFAPPDISPYFWVNGKAPTCSEWEQLEADGFRNYRLTVHGAVGNPVELSLDEMRALGLSEQITLHHCIQGWSGIAQWGGLRMDRLMALVKPLPHATAVVFHSFSDGVALDRPGVGGRYYDSLSLRDAHSPQTILAYEMNGEPLTRHHGAPLRLRVENQLGFKMVKWIQSIEFVEDISAIRGGEGGFAEDHEYFGELANI
ncbi:MAG: molybdopterin-dependent oxidoreductase [Planctomycetes bacterium]|nr:molybdopterin-dependent oxidoreductase [Planctomycetota bacterium]